jgi:hypothetical protein
MCETLALPMATEQSGELALGRVQIIVQSDSAR